jgi:hypothetical protein
MMWAASTRDRASLIFPADATCRAAVVIDFKDGVPEGGISASALHKWSRGTFQK